MPFPTRHSGAVPIDHQLHPRAKMGLSMRRAGAMLFPLLWCLCLVAWLPCGSGLKMQVNSGAEECFAVLLDEERIATASAFEEQLQLRAGFILTNGRVVDGRILSPSGNVLWARRHVLKETEIEEPLEGTEPGYYQLCFRTRSMGAAFVDVAYFDISHTVDTQKIITSPRGSAVGKEEVAQHVHLQEVHNGIVRLKEAVNAVEGQSKYIHKRLKRHVQTTKSTNSRTLNWALVEVAVLVLVALTQVYVYHRMFNNAERKLGGFPF